MMTFVSKQFLAKSGIALIIGIILIAVIVFHAVDWRCQNKLSEQQNDRAASCLGSKLTPFG